MKENLRKSFGYVHGLSNIGSNKFFKLWIDKYEEHFRSDGWGESSINLPYKLYIKNKNLVHVMDYGQESMYSQNRLQIQVCQQTWVLEQTFII